MAKPKPPWLQYSHKEPEHMEDFIPKPRKHRKSRRKKDKQANRQSPAQRTGARFCSATMPAETYVKLREMAIFYKVSMSRMITQLVEPAFEKVYEESMLLLRIEERRRKEGIELEEKLRDKSARRTSF